MAFWGSRSFVEVTLATTGRSCMAGNSEIVGMTSWYIKSLWCSVFLRVSWTLSNRDWCLRQYFKPCGPKASWKDQIPRYLVVPWAIRCHDVRYHILSSLICVLVTVVRFRAHTYMLSDQTEIYVKSRKSQRTYWIPRHRDSSYIGQPPQSEAAWLQDVVPNPSNTCFKLWLLRQFAKTHSGNKGFHGLGCLPQLGKGITVERWYLNILDNEEMRKRGKT